MAEKKIRNLPVKLTDEEWRERVGRRRGLERRRDEIEDKIAREKAASYREVQELDKQIGALGPVVDSRTEIREVEIIEQKDLARRVLEIIRVDTRELVDSRQLTIEESQGDLPLQRVEGERSVSYVSRDAEDTNRTPNESPKKRGPGRPRKSEMNGSVPAPATREAIDQAEAPPLED